MTLFVLRRVARATVAAASSAAGSDVAKLCFAIGLTAALWLGVASFFDPEDAGALVNFSGLFDTGVRLLVIALTPLVLVDVGRAFQCRRRILRLLARLAPAMRSALRTVLGQV